MTLDLTVPVLDSAMQAAAIAINAQRKARHTKEAEPVRPVVSLSGG